MADVFSCTWCWAISWGSRPRSHHGASFEEARSPGFPGAGCTPCDFGTSCFIPSYASLGVSQYISITKKVVKCSEIVITHHLSTSTSIFPVPPHMPHLPEPFLPEPLQDLHACFSSTVTNLTISMPLFSLIYNTVGVSQYISLVKIVVKYYEKRYLKKRLRPFCVSSRTFLLPFVNSIA